MTCGLPIAIVLVASLHVWVLWNLRRLPSPSLWPLTTVVLVLVGGSVGLWLGFVCTYQEGPDFKCAGYSFPIFVLHREEGRWVDYAGDPLLGVLTASIIASCGLIPALVALAIGRLRRGLSRRPDRNKASICSYPSRVPSRTSLTKPSSTPTNARMASPESSRRRATTPVSHEPLMSSICMSGRMTYRNIAVAHLQRRLGPTRFSNIIQKREKLRGSLPAPSVPWAGHEKIKPV